MNARTLMLCFPLVAASALAHEGHLTRIAWDACGGSEVGASCEWEDGAGAVYRGSCRSMSGGVVCVRNRPIERAGDFERRIAFVVLPVVALTILWHRRRREGRVYELTAVADR